MSILVDRDTRLICQGLGATGRFHLSGCLAYARECKNERAIAGGVHPGKGGESFEGLPIFESASEAVREVGANATMIFVPPPFAADAILEAADAGIGLICCITEGIPVRDMVATRTVVEEKGVTLVGPNCPGVITPGVLKIGIMPGYIHRPGTIGIVSRSGTLTYAAVWEVTNLGLGQSTCIGMGGDPVHGLGFVDALRLFDADPDTEAIILIGEIGGLDEQRAAALAPSLSKPIVAFVAGDTAPPGRRMGHAGAIISGGGGTAREKIEAFEQNGVTVARNPAEIGKTLAARLGRS